MTDSVITAVNTSGFSDYAVEETQPSVFRQARYPNGMIVLQGGHRWTKQHDCGITWKPLPLVDVDEEGNEIT